MANSYPLVELEHLVSIHDKRRKPITKGKRTAGIYPYYGASGIADYIDNYEFDGLYVLLAEDGDNLRTRNTPIAFTASGKFWVNNHAHVLQGEDELDTLYICYALQYANIDSYISGSTRPKITQADLKRIKVSAPDISIRRDIAKFVKSFDEKIELYRQTNQTLEKMAQALFKSWFVDFDPVIDNALAAGNDIPEELQHKALIRQEMRAIYKEKAQQLPDFASLPDGLPQEMRALFPSEFEQTDDPNIGIAGWIPKGWIVSNTDAELGIKGGSTPSTKNSDFWDGGDIHWTSPKDLSGNDSKILLDTSRKITEAGLAKITSGLLPVDTVLMSSRAPVGYLALAKVPLAINQGYIALQCEKDLTPEYTMQFLDSIMDEIKSLSGGTTFAEISKKTFRSIKLVVPSKSAIDAYTAIAKANYDKITENIKQTTLLTETRDYLLPKLISGEVILEGICHE